MAIIDTIPEIQVLLTDPAVTDIELVLTGVPVEDRYPCAKIYINHQLSFNSKIVNTCNLKFQSTNPGYLNIKIDYYNKTDNDTVVQDGVIVSNQCIQIDRITVDNTKITGMDIYNVGHANYRLTEEQKTVYNKHGYQWKNVSTAALYNNGTWELSIQSPLIKNLLGKKKIVSHKFEISHVDVLNKLQNYFKE
jgi:hypothetical protein